MTVKLEQLVLILGGTLLAVALLLAVLPVQAAGVGCGAALTGQSREADIADLGDTLVGGPNSGADHGNLSAHADACSDALSSRRTIALVLGIPGLALLGYGYRIRNEQRQATA